MKHYWIFIELALYKCNIIIIIINIISIIIIINIIINIIIREC